jgi:outer membrane receptor protein involved in Fe transport
MEPMHLLRATSRATRVVVLCLALAVTDAWAQRPVSTVSSRVVDARTAEPLAGAHVHAAGRSAHTDAEGRFVLQGVPDTAVVRIERIGYRPVQRVASELGASVALAPEPVLLDGIVAEAPRPNALAAGTALTIGSVGASELAAGAHTSVADALAGAEGIAVSRVGSWGSRFVLRGLGGDRVAVMIDGIRVNQACAFGMDQGVAAIDPATVERIEILTGPGSALYGSGNIGGVVNVVTKRPAGGAAVNGEVRAGASSGVPGGTLGATLGIRRGAFDASIALDGSSYGDFRTPDGTVDGSSFRHGTGDLTLGWSPDEAQRLTFRTQVYEGRDIGWPAMHGASIPAESRRSFALDYGVQLGRGVLDGFAARAYVQRLDHHMRVEMTMGGAMPMTSLTEQRSHSTTSGGRVQLRLLPFAGSHVDVGIEVTEWAAENSRWTKQSGGMGGSTEIAFRTWPGVSIVDAGLFGQGEVEIVSGLTATAGGRIDRVIRSADEQETTRDWVGSGNAGLRLALPHGFGLRTSIGYGYRIPNPTELYGLALKPDGFVYAGNPALDTETNRNVELSLTYDHPRLTASATVFRNDLEGLITPVLAPGDTIVGKPVRTYANLAESRLVGGSGSARWQATPALSLTGSITYTRGEDVATGEALPGIPPLEGMLAARLEDDAGRWLEVEGLAAARQDRIALGAGEVPAAGYGVANARAGFRLAGVDAIVGVDNVFDRAYRAHLDPVRLLRPGRSFYIKLTRRFGTEAGGSDAGR